MCGLFFVEWVSDIEFYARRLLFWYRKNYRQISTTVASGKDKNLNGMMPQPKPREMNTAVPFISNVPCTAPMLGSLSFLRRRRNSALKGNFIWPPWRWPESMKSGRLSAGIWRIVSGSWATRMTGPSPSHAGISGQTSFLVPESGTPARYAFLPDVPDVRRIALLSRHIKPDASA